MARWRTVWPIVLLAACSPRAVPLDAVGVRPCGQGVETTGVAGQCALICRASVPIDFSAEGDPIMTAWIGDAAVRLVLDTGSNQTGLTRAAIERLGLGPPKPGRGRVVGIGGVEARSTVELPELRFGEIKVLQKRVDAITFGRDGAKNLRTRSSADGLLGADVMRSYELDLDMPRSLVTFYEGRPCGDGLPGWVSTDGTLPFDGVAPLPFVSVPVVVDGKRLSALLDTGAGTDVIGVPAAMGLGVTQTELSSDLSERMVGVGAGIVAAHLHRFSSLMVARQDIPLPETAVTNLPFAQPEMLLGETFLRTHKVWISYGAREVSFAHTW